MTDFSQFFPSSLSIAVLFVSFRLLLLFFCFFCFIECVCCACRIQDIDMALHCIYILCIPTMHAKSSSKYLCAVL